MTKENGIIFDFDNTLVATQDFILTHLEKTCNRLGIDPPALDKIQSKLQQNPPFEKIFTDLFGVDGERILAAYRENAMETPYTETSGGNIFVRTMFDQEVPMVIASNRTKMLAERLVQAGYKLEWFLGIVECDPKKPAVGAYGEAVEILKAPETIIAIGDHTDDFLACPKDMRTNFVAVTTGLTTKEEFLGAGVDEQNIWPNLKHQNRLVI